MNSEEQIQRIKTEGKSLDYEAMALESVVRSWDHTDKECQALALADAQVWATLHVANMIKKSHNADHNVAPGFQMD